MGQKSRIFDSRIIPTLICGAQTWAATKKGYKRIKKTQKAMKRSTIGNKINGQGKK